MALTEKPITLSAIKEILPFLVLLTTMVLSWGSLNTQLALLNQKMDSAVEQNDGFDTQLSSLNDKTQSIDVRLARIETIVQSAQAKGLLSVATPVSSNIIASARPNLSLLATTSTTTTTKEPIKEQATPTPIPTIATPTQATRLCVVGLCL